MDGRIGQVLRGGVAAVGVSAGLMFLASTAQTPDGFVHAGFGGPLDLFGSTPPDVLAIGDGPIDATELAALLKSPTEPGDPNTPYRVEFQAGTTPNTVALNVFPTTDPAASAPTAKQSKQVAARPVIDSQGKVDCDGAVSCDFDPATNVTTVTYPDGVVALVQKINDMTVVAYKSIADALPKPLQGLLPPVPTATPAPVAATPTPAQVAAPTSAPVLPPPAPETVAPAIDPGPAVPDSLLAELEDERPKVNITRPPLDFTPGRGGAPNPAPKPNVPGLDKVKDALDSVAGAVSDAVDKVGKAIGAGAADKPAP